MEKMENNELVGLVKQTPQILSSIYGDIAQPSVKKIGIALETVFEFSTSILLPVKLLNEKFKLNFEKRLNEYKKKIEQIPDCELCEVNPQIGTPIIEKLSYTTNDEISDLFTNLLTKASSCNTVNLAHPSFVQLIERLSVDEARIIKYLANKQIVLCITYRAHFKDNKGFIEVMKNKTMLPFEIDMIFPLNIDTYLDNLVSIGIFNISHGLEISDEILYHPLFEKYPYDDISKTYVSTGVFTKVEKTKSYYQITNFGKSFINACTTLQQT